MLLLELLFLCFGFFNKTILFFQHCLNFKCTPHSTHVKINPYDRYEFNQAGGTSRGRFAPETPPRTHTRHTAEKGRKDLDHPNHGQAGAFFCL